MNYIKHSVVTACAIAISFVMQGCVPEDPALDDWYTYQGNSSHTGYVPVDLDHNNFTFNWSADIADTRPLNPLTIADGKVFASTKTYFGDQRLFTLDASTGDIIWDKAYADFHSVHPPAYSNGKVYVTTGGHEDTYLWSYDANNGALIYKSSFENQWSRYYAPTPYEGNIYISGGYYGGAYSFDAVTGEENWFVSLNQYDQWTPAVNDEYAIAFTGDYSPQLTVIDRLTGAELFNIPDPNFDWAGWSMHLAPVIGELGNVLAINGGRLISFDLESRSIGWEISSQFSGQLALANGTIYVIRNGTIEARNEIDGSKIWAWSPGAENIIGTMIVTDNLLFCRTDTTTYAVDLFTKEAVWQVEESGDLAIGKNGNLYLSTEDGRVISYKLM